MNLLSTSDSALLLIEFQEEWLNPEGKLHHLFKDSAQLTNSVINAKKVLAFSRQKHIPIIHAGLHYSDDYQELGKAKYGLRAAIRAHGTFQSTSHGCQFNEDFKPEQNEFIISGRIGASAFSGSNLDTYLRNNRINKLFIMGYALHVCVESTLRAAHDLGYEVAVIADACTAFTASQRAHVLEDIIPHFGTNITTDDYLKIV